MKDDPTNNLLERLAYIADSPAREHGGFHPEAVRTAKDAIAEIKRLRRQLASTALRQELAKCKGTAP